MANADIKYGFQFYKNLAGSGHSTIECVALSSYGTALFEGDAVIAATAGDFTGRPGIQQAVGTEGTASTNIYGVIESISQVDGTLNSHAGAASTTRICQVIPALPEYLFQVNAETGVNPSDVGAMFDLVVAAGDAKTGRSGMEIDDTTATTGAQLTLLGFVDRLDNSFTAADSTTDTTGVDCIVNFHESAWIAGAGIGS